VSILIEIIEIIEIAEHNEITLCLVKCVDNERDICLLLFDYFNYFNNFN